MADYLAHVLRARKRHFYVFRILVQVEMECDDSQHSGWWAGWRLAIDTLYASFQGGS